MKSEQLQKWALISEIIGGVAVLVTLVVLVLEVRGNTRTLQAATYDSLVADIAHARYENARNEAVQEMTFISSTEGYEGLTPRQQDLYYQTNLALFQLYERAFIQWESGNLDEEAWFRFSRIICQASSADAFNERIGHRLDQLTTDSFTQYRNNEC